mgnify:CR=1 FL=1
MFHEIGYEVKGLVRVRVGNLRLGDLPRGHWRAAHQIGARSFETFPMKIDHCNALITGALGWNRARICAATRRAGAVAHSRRAPRAKIERTA